MSASIRLLTVLMPLSSVPALAGFSVLWQERCVDSRYGWHSGLIDRGSDELEGCAADLGFFSGELNGYYQNNPTNPRRLEFSHASTINNLAPGIVASCSINTGGWGNDSSSFWSNSECDLNIAGSADEPMDVVLTLTGMRSGSHGSGVFASEGWVRVNGLTSQVPAASTVSTQVIEYTFPAGIIMIEAHALVWNSPNDSGLARALVEYDIVVAPHEWRAGDMNCDGLVSVADIGGFVLALTDVAAYDAAYPGCEVLNGDVNDDGEVSVSDIGPFVQVLTGG